MQPATVLVVRPSPSQGIVDPEVLIHWKNLAAYEDSWESFAVIRTQSPHFNLENKVNAWAAGNVRPQIQRTYVRRKKGKSSPTDN